MKIKRKPPPPAVVSDEIDRCPSKTDLTDGEKTGADGEICIYMRNGKVCEHQDDDKKGKSLTPFISTNNAPSILYKKYENV